MYFIERVRNPHDLADTSASHIQFCREAQGHHSDKNHNDMRKDNSKYWGHFFFSLFGTSDHS